VRFKAFLLSNWEYNDPSRVLMPLKGPRNDLHAMRDALTHDRFGLFKPEDIVERQNLPWSEMRTEFLRFLHDAEKEDSLLLYFSGHGERRDDGGLVLCGTDTDHKYLEGTSFDTSELRSWIEGHNRAPSTIVILDCCYAGQMKGGLNEQTLVGSLGAGTMVLASAADRPAKDANYDRDPSPFTAALTKILLNPALKGDQGGWLTVDSVYDYLLNLKPPLLPEPHRNVRSQGTLALARRPLPSKPKRPELIGFYRGSFRVPEQIEVVDLRFDAATVVASWESGAAETLELADFDRHRQTAVRRLSQLADAVIRVPDYAGNDWYQEAVQKAWNCVGANLLETAIPLGLRDRLRSAVDSTSRHLLKLRLSFDRNGDSFESYPWEYLHVGQPDEVGGEESELPLALRPGLLIERVAPVARPAVSDAPSVGAAPTVGVVNCLYDKFAPAAARVTDDLTKLADLNVVIDLKGSGARWGPFLDAFAQAPEILLLFAPVRRGLSGVEVGFIADEPGLPEWHLGSELTREFQEARLAFNPLIFVTFAANPGRDAFRGTLELAAKFAESRIGPVVFACHSPGFEARMRDFPVLFVDALTRGVPFDKAFYYAKNRVTRTGNKAVRRAFGVPGYYSAEGKSARRIAAAAPGGQSVEPMGRVQAEEGRR